MEEVIRSIQLLLVICGGVITIGGAYKVFQDWQKPNKDLKVPNQSVFFSVLIFASFIFNLISFQGAIQPFILNT